MTKRISMTRAVMMKEVMVVSGPSPMIEKELVVAESHVPINYIITYC